MKDFVIYGLGELANKVTSFLLIPVYIRHFSVDEYGVVAFVIVFQSIFYIIGNLGMDSGLWGFYDSRDRRHVSRLVSTTIASIVFSSAFFSLLFLSCSASINSYFFASRLSRLDILLLTASFFLDLPANSVLSLLKIEKKSLQYALWSGFMFLVRVGAIIFFVALLKWGISGIVYGLFVSSLIRILVLVQLRGVYSLHFEFGIFKKVFLYGFPFVGDSIFYLLLTFSDRLFLKNYSDFSSVGIYSLGLQLSSLMILLILTPFHSVYVPLVYDLKNPDEGNDMYRTALRAYVFLSLFLLIILSAGSREVISMMSDKSDYLTAYKIVPFQTLAYFVYGLGGGSLCIGMLIMRHSKFIPFIMLAGLAVNVAVNMLLTPTLGIYGSSAALICSFFVITFAKYKISQSLYEVDLKIHRYVVIVLLTALIVTANMISEDLELMFRVLVKTVTTALYLFLVYTHLTKDERAYVTSAVKGLFASRFMISK